MLEKEFEKLYFKFRNNYCKNLFSGVNEEKDSLSPTESYCVEAIFLMNRPTVHQFANYVNISQPNATYRISNLINKGYVDAAVAQDVIAYGDITVDLLSDYVLAGKEIPEGEYFCEGTYWQSCDISIADNQAKVTIPPYIINADNSNDIRHWSYIAEKLWGFQYNK